MTNGNSPKLAFIVGHYKSGSTWLLNLLSLHPQVRGVGETSIFAYSSANPDLCEVAHKLYNEGFWGRGGLRTLVRSRFAEWSRPLRSCWRPILGPHDRPTTRMDLRLFDQRRLRRTLQESTTPEDFCYRFFEFLCKTLQPDGYLIEKNNNIALVPYIKSIFPDAKLIAIYRDGRDVIVSEKYYLKNEIGQSGSFQQGVLNWRRAMESQFSYEKEYGIFTLSYESLKVNGEVVVRNLLEFLGLPADPEIVATMLEKSSFKFVTGRDSGVENSKSFYRKGTVGDWRNHFTEEEKFAFKELAGDILAKLRYEEGPAW